MPLMIYLFDPDLYVLSPIGSNLHIKNLGTVFLVGLTSQMLFDHQFLNNVLSPAHTKTTWQNNPLSPDWDLGVWEM